MADSNKIIDNRKQKIINWFKDPYHLALFGIITLTIILRLYYFFVTNNQPLWWDEADYLSIAKSWAFGLPFEISIVRQILFPLILVPLLKLANNEFLPRLFLLLISIASVLAMYYLGKEMFNEKIGLLSAFLMSVFYLNLFFTYRLLVDLPSLTFFTLSAFFIYKYIMTKSNSALYIGALLIGIGTLFKLSTATLLFAVFIYFFVTERFAMFRKKEIWIALIIFSLVLTPYIIYGYIQFDQFIITGAGAYNAPKTGTLFSIAFSNLAGYLSQFLEYLSWPLLIIFILGLLSLYKLIIGFDVLLKSKNPILNRDFFLLLILIIPLIIVSLSVGHVENRYIITAFPAIFIFSSAFIFKIINLVKIRYKILSIILLILLISSLGFIQIQKANSLIDLKKTSYLEIQEAGLWLKDNANQSDIILTQSIPQITYYAEKQSVGLPDTEAEIDKLIKLNNTLKFLIISSFELHPDWAYTYGQKNNLTIANIYFADKEKTQPVLIIYNI